MCRRLLTGMGIYDITAFLAFVVACRLCIDAVRLVYGILSAIYIDTTVGTVGRVGTSRSLHMLTGILICIHLVHFGYRAQRIVL
jgi:hypothetical protein